MFGISLACLLAAGFILAKATVWGRQYWRITGGYFTDPAGRLVTWALTLALLLLAVIGVRLTVVLSYQGNDLFTSLQVAAQAISTGEGSVLDAAKSMFWTSMGIFGILATMHVVRTLIEIYLGAAFEIRMRTHLTRTVTTDWLAGKAFFRNRFVHRGIEGEDAQIQPGVDNPDQRIEIDIDNIASYSRRLVFGSGGSTTNGVIPAVITIVSFTKILWDLSGPMTVFGIEIDRAMVWFVYLFVIVATVIAFWIGHPLIRLYFLRERLSANFRYALVRVRDAAENVAMYNGENVERSGLLHRFDAVVGNFWQIIYRTLKFTGWNFVINQLSAVFAYMIQAPRFFAGQITLGDMSQTSSAFGNVHDSLSFFRTAYDDFADLRATLYRLDGLTTVNGESRALPEITTSDADRLVQLDRVDISTPAGDQLITGLSLTLNPGSALVVKGRSGVGKTTLLRGLAGLWPFVDGEFTRPPGADTLFLSQMPYLPLGDLRTAVAYPLSPTEVPTEAIVDALNQVFLGHLADRLDAEEDWAKVLSPGEQQRIAFARILLVRPQAVFLDEATSAVDEGLEFALYTLIRTTLPDTIVVSVSHRSTTDRHHGETLELVGGGGWQIRPTSPWTSPDEL